MNERVNKIMNNVRLFAMYLPQYHQIEENSEFWGDGFTDWVAVKNSKALYKNHQQPRIPLNGNYYDLSVADNIKWQSDIATSNAIDGFAIYHYWFNENQNLLDTPPKLILENKDIKISFFFAWDNTNWVRSWSRIKGNSWFLKGETNKSGQTILVKYEIGRKPQWQKHFEWLLPFFRDERYEKKDNKPIFMILTPSPAIKEMADFWQILARKYGYEGIHFIYRWDAVHVSYSNLIKKDFVFRYEPSNSGWSGITPRIINKIEQYLGMKHLKKYDFDKIWHHILVYANKNANKNEYYCAFIDYDDTPRRGINGRVVEGMTVEKFYLYFKQLYEISCKQNKDYMFITAWNEWGEGAYLEPDENNKFELLHAIKRVVKG